MKKQLRVSIILLLAGVVITINGCKKGDEGSPGKDGSANVTAYTYSISTSTWSYSSPEWYCNLSLPELTADNLNSASVQAYFQKTANTWIAIPTTFYNTPSNYYMGYSTTIGNVKINWIYNGAGSGNDPNTHFGITSQFKVVIIPPAMITANSDLDLKNYQAVKDRFNLKD